MKRTTILIIILGIAASSVWTLSLIQRPEQQKTFTGPVMTIRVATVSEYSTLIFLAERFGFFRDNGLNIVTTEYSSGAPSFQAMLRGDVDIATAADFVGVSNSLETLHFRIIASMFDSGKVFQLVARKDHGIRTPADLRQKKIGLTKKTMGEFFLGTFLSSHGLLLKDVTQVDGDPALLKAEIERGEIDAAITFPPHVNNIAEALGDNAIVFDTQGNQLLYTLVYADRAFTKEHPEGLLRFIRALWQAEQFAENHPDEMKKFFAEKFGYSPEYIDAVLSHYNFRLSLSQAMLLAMEDEARFAIVNKLAENSLVPNYFELIYFDALDAVNPDAVSIIH